MATYSQKNRPFRVYSTLGTDVLLLLGFTGQEGVSMLYEFTLELLSDDPGIDGKGLLNKPVHIEMDVPGGSSKRYISGRVKRFVQLGRHENLTSYRAEIVPVMWYLTLRQDCRIFQAKSALDVIKQILKDCGVDKLDVRCSGAFPTRDYCVQYRESDFDFISRLMEEEGIFYFFEHAEDGETLVLANTSGSFAPLPSGAKVDLMVDEAVVLERDVVSALSAEHVVHTSKVELRDYNPLEPGTTMQGKVGSDKLEYYDYPGRFSKNDDGGRYARIQLEQFETMQEVVRGAGNVRAFIPGFRFDLAGHYRRDLNKGYTLLHISQSCSGGDYRSWENNTYTYANNFVAIPSKNTFRPPTVTTRPIVHGTQPAVVVGPAGEEIYVDKYGRVKVQFFWDREGKKDEKSSCWVRVSATWAGKQWGFIQIPRIGQEVLVDFLEGDPDAPIIVGRVYNAEQMPPWELPANMTQSGALTRSTKGGSPANANAVRFEDKKGSEQLWIHAEKNEDEEIEHNRTQWVGHDETETVDHDQTLHVKHDRARTVDNNEAVTIGKNQTISIGENQTVSIEGNRAKSIAKNETTTIEGNRSENVTKDETIDIGGKRTETVAKDESVSIGEKRTITVGKDDALDVGKKLAITVADEITIKTGDASITMKKDGSITIKGKDIKLDGSGKISVKASSDVSIKGSKVTQN